MKLLKIIGMVVGVLILLPLIAALFIPKQYTVSVSTEIKQPKSVVYDYVKLLQKQSEYTVWAKEDPATQYTFTGTDGTVGALQTWDSKNDNVGAGQQEIIRMTDDSIVFALSFTRPMESKALAATICSAIDSSTTKVSAEFYGNDPYPINIFSIFIKDMLKEAETQNLQNLKAILEKK